MCYKTLYLIGPFFSGFLFLRLLQLFPVHLGASFRTIAVAPQSVRRGRRLDVEFPG